jgi:hypothetical protein
VLFQVHLVPMMKRERGVDTRLRMGKIAHESRHIGMMRQPSLFDNRQHQADWPGQSDDVRGSGRTGIVTAPSVRRECPKPRGETRRHFYVGHRTDCRPWAGGFVNKRPDSCGRHRLRYAHDGDRRDFAPVRHHRWRHDIGARRGCHPSRSNVSDCVAMCEIFHMPEYRDGRCCPAKRALALLVRGTRQPLRGITEVCRCCTSVAASEAG